MLSDRRREPPEATAAEVTFIRALAAKVPDVHVHLHEPADLPWLVASVDIVDHGRIVATPRVDFYGDRLLGGLSPADFNWDDSVSADQAGIDPNDSMGLPVGSGRAEELADAAANWFIWIRTLFGLRLE